MVSSWDGGLLSGTELVYLISPTENGAYNDCSTVSAGCLKLASLHSALPSLEAAGVAGVAATTGSGVATTGSGVATTCSGSAKSSSSVASWAFFLFFFLANCLAWTSINYTLLIL